MLPPAPPAGTKPKSRKRAAREEEATVQQLDSLGLGNALAFGSDGEEDEGAMVEDDDEVEVEEPFPEVDFGISTDEDFFSGSGSEDDEEEDDSEEQNTDDEAAMLAELEAEDAELSDSSDGSDLDSLIARHTTKPYEGDMTPGTSYEDPTMLKNYMARARTVISDITGGEKTIWDEEIDAGYGSDSSTEEVGCLHSFAKG